MEHIACAFGFSRAWDGEYQLIKLDHWSNADGTYWIYHDSSFWYISDSEYCFDNEHVMARKPFGDRGSWIDGTYEGVNGQPNGYIKLGTC